MHKNSAARWMRYCHITLKIKVMLYSPTILSLFTGRCPFAHFTRNTAKLEWASSKAVRSVAPIPLPHRVFCSLKNKLHACLKFCKGAVKTRPISCGTMSQRCYNYTITRTYSSGSFFHTVKTQIRGGSVYPVNALLRLHGNNKCLRCRKCCATAHISISSQYGGCACWHDIPKVQAETISLHI